MPVLIWVWDMLSMPSLEVHTYGGGSKSKGGIVLGITNSHMVSKTMKVDGIVQEDM